MTSLEGFDNNDFASFNSEEPEVQQLPSLPIDNVLPKANESVQFKEDEEVIENHDANVILPTKPTKPEESNVDSVVQFLADYSPYIFALIFLLVAYWYSQKY